MAWWELLENGPLLYWLGIKAIWHLPWIERLYNARHYLVQAHGHVRNAGKYRYMSHFWLVLWLRIPISSAPLFRQSRCS